jgi:lactate dehydrogenase-like 2-hydroxyacid dehydrogenase
VFAALAAAKVVVNPMNLIQSFLQQKNRSSAGVLDRSNSFSSNGQFKLFAISIKPTSGTSNRQKEVHLMKVSIIGTGRMGKGLVKVLSPVILD